MPPYIPPRDAEYMAWLDNFADLIVAAPATYGLVAADATAIDNARDAFRTAYDIAVNPGTRTKPSVADKDNERAASEATVRPYAIEIRNNQGISDMDKLTVGVTVPDPTPTPIPAPSTSPLLNFIAATPLQHTLRFADQNTPDSRAKPFGAVSLQLYRSVGVAAATDPVQADFVASVTKNPVAVNFLEADKGKIATYFSRWQSRRGEVGPWSEAITAYVTT